MIEKITLATHNATAFLEAFIFLMHVDMLWVVCLQQLQWNMHLIRTGRFAKKRALQDVH